MPAYSFKEQFCQFVIEGSKPHTVRSRRKHPAKVGDTCYLYYGLRTKWVKKLREETCTETHSLVISEKDGIVMYAILMKDELLKVAVKNPFDKRLPPFYQFNKSDCDLFAWKDGFRPKGTDELNCKGSFDLMLKFWKETHELPWAGDIIIWNPKK
jgi:hypothetical protein